MEGALGLEVQVMDSNDAAEADVVRSACAGEREAFRALIQTHQSAVLRLGAAMLKDEARAADLAQEVFLTFWRERSRYQHRGRLRAYLLGIARNRALAQLARQRSRTRLVEIARRRPTTPVPDPELQLARAQDGSRLAEALDQLPEARREAVSLRFLHGLSVREVAEVCGVPEGTVKSRIGRGLAALREALGREQ